MDVYEKLAALINKIIHEEGGSWQEKAAKVKAAIDEGDLEEFVAWFPEDPS